MHSHDNLTTNHMRKQSSMDILDIAKFVLSIFVIAIHAVVLPTVLNPLLRIAVPLFFMISSYLFFGKVKNLDTAQAKNSALKKFVKRNMRFYLFWFVLLLPVTVLVRGYFSNGLLAGILTFVRDFFLGSTFRASWYIMALLIGVTLVYFASYRLSVPSIWLFLVAVPAYILCCLSSNYLGLASQSTLLQSFFSFYGRYFGTIFNSFPAGLIWTLLGKWMAEHEISVKKWTLNCLIIICFLALYTEQYLILHSHWLVGANDCYFSLLLLVPCLFAWLLQQNVTCPYAPALRAASSVAYAFHASFITLLSGAATIVLHAHLHPIVLFAAACLACFTLTYLILRLEKLHKLRFLTYAH